MHNIFIKLCSGFIINYDYSANLSDVVGLKKFTTLSILPWYHINGLNFVIGLSIHNHKSVFFSKFEEKAYLNAIQVR